MTRRAKQPQVEAPPTHTFLIRLEASDPLVCTCRWRADVQGLMHAQIEVAKLRHWRQVGVLPEVSHG